MEITQKLEELTIGSSSSDPAAEPPAQLQLGPKRPRPELNTKTVCPRCGSALEWSHMMKRHQLTQKCKYASLQMIIAHKDVP
jgi:hypothetical protein